MVEKQLMSLLGLAQRARKIAAGDTAVTKAVQGRKAKLLLVAVDTSPASKEKICNRANYYGVPSTEILTKAQMGQCTGKAQRAALAIMDTGFSQSIKKILESQKIVE